MDLSIAKRPCDSVTNKDWEMNAFLPENKRHFLPQDTLATKNHSSHFAPNLTLLSFQIRTCADVIQRCHSRVMFSAFDVRACEDRFLQARKTFRGVDIRVEKSSSSIVSKLDFCVSFFRVQPWFPADKCERLGFNIMKVCV